MLAEKDHYMPRCKLHMNQIGMCAERIIKDIKASALTGKAKIQMCTDIYVPLGMMAHAVDKFSALKDKCTIELKNERRHAKEKELSKRIAKAKCGVKPATLKQAAATMRAIKMAAPKAANKKDGKSEPMKK